jgi:hypothetical protein
MGRFCSGQLFHQQEQGDHDEEPDGGLLIIISGVTFAQEADYETMWYALITITSGESMAESVEHLASHGLDSKRAEELVSYVQGRQKKLKLQGELDNKERCVSMLANV